MSNQQPDQQPEERLPKKFQWKAIIVAGVIGLIIGPLTQALSDPLVPIEAYIIVSLFWGGALAILAGVSAFFVYKQS